MSEKKCPICGEPTYLVYGKYPRKDGLCGKHAQELFTKEITQCPDCGKWHKTNEECECRKIIKTECYFCGKAIEVNELSEKICQDCEKQISEIETTINSEQDISQLTDYYYNIKNKLWTYKDDYYIIALYKMKAIANITYEKYEYQSLKARVQNDIENAIQKRIAAKEKKQETDKLKLADENSQLNKAMQKRQEQEERDNKRIIRAADGHKVLSDGEKAIDDTLYSCRVAHSYGMELPFGNESNRYCDFFIPVAGDLSGIYIEYWGMDDNLQYEQNKKEKIKLYQSENVAFIGIEKDEPIKDSQGFKVRLIKEINQKAKNYFAKDKFIKFSN